MSGLPESFAVATHALSMRYSKQTALDAVDLRVPAGALPGEVRGAWGFSLSARSSTSTISSTCWSTFEDRIASVTFSCVKVCPCPLKAAARGFRLATGSLTPGLKAMVIFLFSVVMLPMPIYWQRRRSLSSASALQGMSLCTQSNHAASAYVRR